MPISCAAIESGSNERLYRRDRVSRLFSGVVESISYSVRISDDANNPTGAAVVET